jgi:PIN domain nuclease of toxin-antitoxin system
MIVLDTHAWIWWVSDPEKLSRKARAAINYAKRIGICPISCWEIATKVAHGKLKLDRDIRVWMSQVLAHPKVSLVEISADIAITAGYLGQEGFHGDSADRLIVATTKHNGAELVTKDKSIRAFQGVRSVW